MSSNTSLFTPAFCYGAAILAAFVTALSQIILKKQANITEAKKSGFFSKFLNPRVIISYGLLFSTLVINQVALIHVPVSVMPCITMATGVATPTIRSTSSAMKLAMIWLITELSALQLS